MNSPKYLFVQEVFFGKSKRNLSKLTLQAAGIDITPNGVSSTIRFSVENGITHDTPVYAETQFDCLNIVMGNFRNWLEFIQDGHPGTNFYIERLGELEKSSINMIFFTEDCVSEEIEDKIEFAEKHGYKDGWLNDAIPEASSQYVLDIYSDFNQIHIFDHEFTPGD